MPFGKKASFVLNNCCKSNEGMHALEDYPVYLFDIHMKPVTLAPLPPVCFSMLSPKVKKKRKEIIFQLISEYFRIFLGLSESLSYVVLHTEHNLG